MTAAWKEKAEAWMKAHEEEYLGELAELVAIRSVSEPDAEKPFGEGCRRVLHKALELGESHGLTPANFDGKIGLLRVPNGEVRSVGLWGHLDVVPEGDGWVRDPFRMTREDYDLFLPKLADSTGGSVGAEIAGEEFSPAKE